MIKYIYTFIDASFIMYVAKGIHQSGNAELVGSSPAGDELLAFGHTFSSQFGVYYNMPHNSSPRR